MLDTFKAEPKMWRRADVVQDSLGTQAVVMQALGAEGFVELQELSEGSKLGGTMQLHIPALIYFGYQKVEIPDTFPIW
jgi:hypothetical protein